jgi:hypothetical protein
MSGNNIICKLAVIGKQRLLLCSSMGKWTFYFKKSLTFFKLLTVSSQTDENEATSI